MDDTNSSVESDSCNNSPQTLPEDSSTEVLETTTSRSRTFQQKNTFYRESLKTSQSNLNCQDYCERVNDDSCHDTAECEHLQDNCESVSRSLAVIPSSVDISPIDGRRTRRNSKRRREMEEHCPVCGITLRPPELESHFAVEVEKLDKISKNHKKPPKNDDGISTPFVQVRSNRENRLSAKVAKYAEKRKNEVQCQICKVKMSGNPEEISKHVALCAQHEEDNEEFIIVDNDDDLEVSEVYEFGDQTRIRPIDLVPGGHRSLHGQNSSQRNRLVDEDLDVDIDDTMAFGQPQYTELDVIPNGMNSDNELHAELRKAVLNDPTAQPQVLESRKWSDDTDTGGEVENNNISTQNHIVLSLKERIKDLKDQNNSIKCLICMEPYTKPVVSTACWHVHCEECWLMTMGVKKLCPQCNMIVFPADLRKIYL